MEKNWRMFIKNNYENILFLFFMGCLAFLFLINSPLHPWLGADTGTDSSVFKTLALQMEEGLMPYKDSFDHKGPLIYILNYWGNKISYYRGIWLIEFLFMTITFFMIYKIARLSCSIKNSFFVMLVSISLLFGYFEGGNLTEEYAMPFIAIAIYYFVDYLKNNKISKLRILISGINLGCILLLRPNMIAVWFVFCIAIFILTIKKQDWITLLKFVVYFTLGITIILVPIIIWLAINNSLIPFWNDYIVFNSIYSSTLFEARWSSFWFFFDTIVFKLAFFGMLYTCNKRNKILNITYLFYMILNLLLISMSGRIYGHYGMVIVPAMAYPFSLVFEEIENIKIQDVCRTLAMIVGIYLMSVLITPNWITLVKKIPYIHQNRNIENNSGQVNTIIGIIDKYTEKDENISVYGNWNIIYVLSQRKPASIYSYQFPIGQVMPEIMDEYLKQLQEELPPIIVIQQGIYPDNNMNNFLKANEYKIIWGEEGKSAESALVYLR